MTNIDLRNDIAILWRIGDISMDVVKLLEKIAAEIERLDARIDYTQNELDKM